MNTRLSLAVIAVLLLGFSSCGQAKEPTVELLIARLTADTVSAEELKATEASLGQASAEEVLPLLLPLVSKGMPTGGIYNSGGVEHDANARSDWRIFYSADRVWRPHAIAAPRLAARLLVEQIAKTQSPRGRRALLVMIGQYWSKAAEPVVVDTVKRWKHNPSTWLAAAHCLVQHQRVAYDKLLTETALAQPESDWKQQSFKGQFMTTLFEYRNLALFRKRERGVDDVPPIKPSLLIAGMKLLQKMEAHKPGMGYFLALSLADYVEEEFKANQDDSRFANGSGGLDELFFIESSQNALRWWQVNKSKYETMQSP